MITPEELGIPEDYRGARLTDKGQACQILREFLKAERRDVFRLLLGDYGTGKSHACYALQYELQGHALLYNGKRLRDRATWDLREELLRTTTEMPYWLIIDDLGAEGGQSTDYFESVIRQIVDTRYSKNMKTVLTSNWNEREFEEAYGTAVMERIKHKGGVYKLQPINYRRLNDTHQD